MSGQLSEKQVYYRDHSVIDSREKMSDDVGIISVRETNRVYNIDLELQSNNIRTIKTRTSSTTRVRALLGNRVTSTKWCDWATQEWNVTLSENNLSLQTARYMENYLSLHSAIHYMVVTKAELDAFEYELNKNIAEIADGESYDPEKVFYQSITDAGISLPQGSCCVVS